ncbi:hypothetical protein HK098_002953 [Nowakowskiella sp. JEL0407]|nr:hypothetical protein HK098_002953 [Nowakowskiella sp. JEL0407]
MSEHSNFPSLLSRTINRVNTSSSLSSIVSTISQITLRKRNLHKHANEKPSVVLGLPLEILTAIFAYVDPPYKFAGICKLFRNISLQINSRCDYFSIRYGCLSIVKVYLHHRDFLTPETLRIFLKRKFLVPRFFLQIVLKSEEFLAKNKQVCEILRSEGERLYGEALDLDGSDTEMFEKLTNDMAENISQVKTLITHFKFVPLSELSVVAHFRLFQLSRFNIEILDTLIQQNGLDIKPINDRIMLWVVTDTNEVGKYLKRGFVVTDEVVFKVFRDKCTPAMIGVLRSCCGEERLVGLAVRAMMEMFSENGKFQADVATLLCESFNLSEKIIEKCLLIPIAGFSKTRCYDQRHPEIAWRWILKRYGPSHEFTKLCFSDVIVWVGDMAERNATSRGLVQPPIWTLPLQFLLEMDGMLFEPFHVKYLCKSACSLDAYPQPVRSLQRISEWVFEQNQLELYMNYDQGAANMGMNEFGIPLQKSKTGGKLDAWFSRIYKGGGGGVYEGKTFDTFDSRVSSDSRRKSGGFSAFLRGRSNSPAPISVNVSSMAESGGEGVLEYGRVSTQKSVGFSAFLRGRSKSPVPVAVNVSSMVDNDGEEVSAPTFSTGGRKRLIVGRVFQRSGSKSPGRSPQTLTPVSVSAPKLDSSTPMPNAKFLTVPEFNDGVSASTTNSNSNKSQMKLVLTEAVRREWITALRKEVLENKEFGKAMQRVQNEWRLLQSVTREGGERTRRQSMDVSKLGWDEEAGSPKQFLREAENLARILGDTRIRGRRREAFVSRRLKSL